MGEAGGLTSQKLSMLSRITAGTTFAFFKLENPRPSTAVCSMKLRNISQPHSRYFTSPVILHM